MRVKSFLLLSVWPIVAVAAQVVGPVAGDTALSGWAKEGAFAIFAGTMLYLFIDERKAARKERAAWNEQVKGFHAEWKNALADIARQHDKAMEEIVDEGNKIILENTQALSASTQTRGEAMEVIRTLKSVSVCPYAGRPEERERSGLKRL